MLIVMEGSESFTDTVLSWSLEDICNENLYKHQVGSPESFQSDLHQYFASYKYPLLEDTRAQLQCRIGTMYKAPFGKVISIQESNPHGTKQYNVKVDSWRNSVSKECKTRPGDLFILVDAKAESVSDLQKEGRSWMFLIAIEVFPKSRSEDDGTSLHFKARTSKKFDVNSGIPTSLFIIFLENIGPNIRIYEAMHMCTSARWRVTFSDNFLKSFEQLISFRTKMSILSLLLKLSSGWRSKKSNVDTVCRSSSMIVKKFKVEGLYVVCSTDVVKHLRYMQVLKIWDILPDLYSVETLVNRLDCFFVRHTDRFIKLCCVQYVKGDLEIPMIWPASLDVIRYKDLSVTSDSVEDVSKDESYVENSKVSESLWLMKFYSLSSGFMNHLLSDIKGRELVLPFEVTDEEMEAILYNRSTFIAGRSGTGKTTVLTMKLFQKEQYYNMAEEGLYAVEQSSGGSNATVLRQIFVTVSPKLCIAVKQHVSNLKSFASGVSCHSAEFGSFDQDDCDDTKAEFRDLPNSFLDIPSKCYPLFITFHKFLMMLDGSLSNSYFERFLDNQKLPRSPLQSSRSTLLKSFIRTKEVNYERFCSSYWPHFNMKLTKRLDALRVFTEIISHIKGGPRALEAGDGKLSQSDYVKMSECRASNLCQKEREIIYAIFQAYEKMKTGNGEYDIADFVIDIHRRLQREKYKGAEINFVYIDEVQDLTMSQIMLFKHICSNVEEGFVFSGDTAQTISKGIDFRFQDIRHLFYKKFVLDSRSNEHNQRNDKAEISKIFHLSQNFRTHGGVLRLSQSIIDLLCHFFTESIDSLNPETSPIRGEAPVLLQYRENEDTIVKLFGSSATNFVGFGAEQVILVRDASVQKEISNSVGKQALVLTIVECKGFEFQDVLLYKYFGSSPLINEWRLIYNYMKEHDLLDPTLPKPFPTFDRVKHNFLCSELKQLYVAISRTRKRLWIYEDMEDHCNPMFDYWIKKSLVQVRQLDDSFVEKMKVSSSAEEWKSRGMKLYHERSYEMATICFQNAHDTYWERRSKAGGLQVMASYMQTSNPEEAKSILREAAEIFEDIEMASSAAQCFFDSGDYERAGMIYKHKCGKQAREKAAECFFLAECYESAAEIFQSIGKAESAARCYYKLREYERAGTINLKSSGDEPGLKRARKAREAVAKPGHDNEAGNGDSKARNHKLGGGKLPTVTPSLAGTTTLESSGDELGLKRARKAREVVANSGHDIEAGNGDSKAMNQKSGGGKLPTCTLSLAWSGVVVVLLLAGAFVVYSIYKLDLWSKIDLGGVRRLVTDLISSKSGEVGGNSAGLGSS